MDPEKPEGKAVSCSHALSKSTHIPNVKTTKINNVDYYTYCRSSSGYCQGSFKMELNLYH